jgi:hypothetical protein
MVAICYDNTRCQYWYPCLSDVMELADREWGLYGMETL